MAVQQVSRRRRGRALLVTTGVGLALAAAVPAVSAATAPPGRPPTDPADQPGYARFYHQQPVWGECEPVSVTGPEDWERLDAELAGLRAGDASIVALTAPPTTIGIENMATTCQDLPDRRTAAQVLHDAARTSRTAPVFGTEITAGSPCLHWPARAPAPPHELDAPGVPPVLVVGITRDTAGPYRWSTELVAQLGNARLLTFDGAGHGAYLLDRCVRDAVNGFLADGTLPPQGTVCRAA